MNRPPPPELDLPRLAHDLRGPLMPLRTAAWLLRNELAESPRACELAAIVERQSDRLAKMMDELSDWARSADAHATFERTSIDPALALDMAIGAIPGCASQARLVGAADALDVLAEPHRLAQLLGTLIQHAMHRTGGESPDIEISSLAGQLHVCVRDRGPELDEGTCEALLVEPQDRPFDGGLGLRLLLARRIAEAHGGSLIAAVNPDGGLDLLCRLPLSNP